MLRNRPRFLPQHNPSILETLLVIPCFLVIGTARLLVSFFPQKENKDRDNQWK